LTFAQKLVQNMKARDYFKTLFPQIKEQKPGFDYYAKITFWQFIICIYLINYYTDLDARGTQILENTNQFSIYMVVMLFFQVAIMVIERYISRTNTRIARRGEKVDDYLSGGKKGTIRSTTKQTTTSMSLKQTSSGRRVTVKTKS